jgi:hypothetical protein
VNPGLPDGFPTVRQPGASGTLLLHSKRASSPGSSQDASALESWSSVRIGMRIKEGFFLVHRSARRCSCARRSAPRPPHRRAQRSSVNLVRSHGPTQRIARSCCGPVSTGGRSHLWHFAQWRECTRGVLHEESPATRRVLRAARPCEPPDSRRLAGTVAVLPEAFVARLHALRCSRCHLYELGATGVKKPEVSVPCSEILFSLQVLKDRAVAISAVPEGR